MVVSLVGCVDVGAGCLAAELGEEKEEGAENAFAEEILPMVIPILVLARSPRDLY
jgi:hypothetical protein